MGTTAEHISSLLDEAYEARINDLKKSVDLTNEALILSKEIDDKALIGQSLSKLALFRMIVADYDESMRLSEEAISYFEDLGDEIGVADAKYNIAGIYYKTDNLHSGLMYLIDCLHIYRKHDNYHQQARVLKALGTIYEYFGDENRAVETYLESIELSKKAKDLNLESNVLNPLSGIYLNRGQTPRAMKLIQLSIKIKEQTGDIRGLAFALYGRAKIYTSTGEYRKAEKNFLDAMDIHMEAGEKLGVGMVYHKLGYLYMKWGKNQQAKELLKKGAAFGEQKNIGLINFKCNYLLYLIYKEEGDSDEALKYLEIYLAEKESIINTQTLKIIESYEIITKMENLEKETRLQKEKAEIIEKKNLAEHSAKMKEEFLSTMSHEIRTPLNAVITISSMLTQGKSSEDQQLIDTLNFSAKNLLYIINDILDFTKLDSGKVILDNRPTDFNSLLENICNTYDGLAKEKGIELKLSVDPELHNSYKLDETKFSQIIGNLISNAIKFTEKGEVEFEVKKLSSDKNGRDAILFNVKDSGEGIPFEFQEQIFESFSQPKTVKTRKAGGSGLGLAIVKKLVNLYNSNISVMSIPGKGSEFFFELNLEKSRKPDIETIIPSEVLEGFSILLAEDNRVNAMVLGKLLSNWGVAFDHAKNGLEVVEMANSKSYHCILMDIHMPEMDGFEATKRIKKEKGVNLKTPIYALTADVTAEQQPDYLLFFDGFLLKPIEKEKLYEALSKEKLKLAGTDQH